MPNTVVLVTGANGEIGRSLLQTLARHGGYDAVTLDLTPLPDSMRSLVAASYAGNIMDRFLLDQLAAHHEVDMVFHLAALLSTRGERDPELAHQVNVEGTLNALGWPRTSPRASGGPCASSSPRLPSAVYSCSRRRREGAGRARARRAVERAHHHVRMQQALLRARRPLP